MLRDVVDVPSLEILKVSLDGALGSLISLKVFLHIARSLN